MEVVTGSATGRQAVAFLSLLLSLLAAAPEAHARRFTVCALSFHGPSEIQVFKDRMPVTDFEVLDLSPHQRPMATPASGERATHTSWLFDLCRPDLRCDVMVYSAEFAGTFFGASGTSLRLGDMEEASCQARCEGLFHAPLEVFLLGCNTLATKDQDSRSPAEYLQVLLDHDFDRATAERVVEMRYGPFGPSFREALRRVFMDVPRVYGFASVAPSGEHSAPLLERYFQRKGDYRRWLEETGRGSDRNAELLAVFQGTGLVQTTGLTDAEPAGADRRLVCRLYDEREAVWDRLSIMLDLMARPDFLAFLPALQVFIERHPSETLAPDELRLFEEVQRSAGARDEVLRLVRELGVSALQLELAHTAWHLGWLTAAEFRTLGIEAARLLLQRPLTDEVVDIMCEIPRHVSLRDEFGSDDLPPALFTRAEGIRLVSCLAPADPRVNARLVPGLDHPDPLARLWAAYALSERLPLDDATLVRLASHLNDPSADLRERLRWIFVAQPPVSDAVRRAVALRDPGFAATLQRPAKERRHGWFW